MLTMLPVSGQAVAFYEQCLNEINLYNNID